MNRRIYLLWTKIYSYMSDNAPNDYFNNCYLGFGVVNNCEILHMYSKNVE